MAGVISNDQWSIREKLCLASSVIRSGDQNWVSVSRAIKPFGEGGRPPDWFSQKNCACQYSALLETVETPKRKRSERGEVVDTPGDLIVRKMTQERIHELKAQLEEDKARYRQLQTEIEQIRCGQADDRLQGMWDEIQEQKQAAKEAEEAQRLAAEAAKAAAAAKPSAKPGFQSPSKRRPPTKTSRPVSRTPSTDAPETEESSQAPSAKTSEEPAQPGDSSAAKPLDSLTSSFLSSLAAASASSEQETAASEQEELIPDPENDEAAEKLLAATASDLVELLSPYPEDSPSSQSLDDSLQPAPDAPAPVPAPAPPPAPASRTKEPIILLIQKGVAKNKEPQVEPKGSQSETCQEMETVIVDEPVPEQPTENQQPPLDESQVASREADGRSHTPQPAPALRTETAAAGLDCTEGGAGTGAPAHPPRPAPKSLFPSPTGKKSLSPEEQRAITEKLDAALYECPGTDGPVPSPVRWLRSIRDRRKRAHSGEQVPRVGGPDGSPQTPGRVPEKGGPLRQAAPKQGSARATAADSDPGCTAMRGAPATAVGAPAVDGGGGPGAIPVAPRPVRAPTGTAALAPRGADRTPGRAAARNRSPGNRASPLPAEDKLATPATKVKSEPAEEGYLQVEPPSPDDSSSRDDVVDVKAAVAVVKKKPGRGRPAGSQRKSSRIRTITPAEEEEEQPPPGTPSGRRSAGKDSSASGIASLMGEDSKDDTHSEAGDSDATDKPSESDDLSASASGLQSSFFLDSLPNSPASVAHSEEDHAYKIWRKAIMLVWRAIASHKYANVFLHPVTEDIAPGYQTIVLRPMNLTTIKKNIETGVIRTTEQFHRDMMVMFQNAIMYNNADQHVHQIATIMQADVVKQIEEFVSTQLLVQQPDSTKMLRGRGKQGQGEEDRSRRSSTDTDTSGKKRRTRADEY